MSEDKEPLKMEIANSSDPLVATNIHDVTSQNTMMFVLIAKSRFHSWLANLYMRGSD